MSFLKVVTYGTWTFLVIALVVSAFVACRYGRHQMLSFGRNNSELIKITFVLLAGIYTAAQFQLSVIDARIGHTIELLDKLENDRYNSAFRDLRNFWLTGEPFEVWKKYRKNKISEQEFAEISYKYVREKKQESNIATRHEFYASVVVCVEQDRCHEETACQLFGQDIENFRLTYRKFITEWAQAWGGNIDKTLRRFYYDCEGQNYIP